MKKLTIVIPAYNAIDTISQTLYSILMQTKNDEVKCIIVDDCSEYSYEEIVNKFSNLLEIELIRLKVNQGPSYARNEGLRRVQTPYVMFMDADDNLIHPYVIEKLMTPLLEDEKGYMIVSNFIEQGEENNLVRIVEEDYIWVFGKIYKTDYLKKHNIYFGQYNQNEDTAFNMECRLAATANDYIYTLHDVTYSWNFRENAITKKNNAEYTFTTSSIGAIGNIRNVLKKYKNNINDNEFYYSNLLKYLISGYYSYNQMLIIKNGYDKPLLKELQLYYKELIDHDDIIFNNPYIDFSEIYTQISISHYTLPYNLIQITFQDFLNLLKK